MVAIECSNINMFFIGAPGNTGQVFVQRCTRFNTYCLLCFRIEDLHRNLMRSPSSHWVLNIISFGRCNIPIDNGIIIHHRLVHFIISQQITFGRKENATIYTKLITMHGLPTDDIWVRFVGHLNIIKPKIIVHRIGHILCYGCNENIFSTFCQWPFYP